MMDLTDLDDTDRAILRALAADATLSAGALGRRLGLSQPAAWRRIKRLEDKLGTRLLQRTTRQISLTEAGQGFHERVVAILAGIEEAEAFVSRRSALAHGVLKVSAPTSFGRMHIAPHINAFMQANPDLGVNLMLRDEFVDIVGDGYDLAIRIAELSDSSLVARKLAPVRRVLVTSPDYLKRHGTPETLEDLEDHICLAPHNNDSWKLEGPQGEMLHRPIGPLQTNSSEVVREAVIGGVGIALRSTWDIGAELNDGRLIQVLPAYEGSRNVAIHAVYASRRFLPAKVRLFIDYLAELYGPTPYWDTQQDDR